MEDCWDDSSTRLALSMTWSHSEEGWTKGWEAAGNNIIQKIQRGRTKIIVFILLVVPLLAILGRWVLVRRIAREPTPLAGGGGGGDYDPPGEMSGPRNAEASQKTVA